MEEWWGDHWKKVALVVLALAIGFGNFFAGAAWGGKWEKTPIEQIVQPPAPEITTAPPDYGEAILAKLGEIADQRSQPVTVNVSPPAVTVTANPVVNVNVVINDAETSQDQSSQDQTETAVYGPCVGNFEALVYQNNFNDYKGTFRESTINHDWRSGGPFNLARFSVKWRGDIVLDYSGFYEFKVTTDDKVRVYIDDKLVIDQWSNSPAVITGFKTGPIQLTAGSHKVVVKYFNDLSSNSYIKLEYRPIA
jgi:hypothetical protein